MAPELLIIGAFFGLLLAAVAAGILLQWFLPGARRRMGLAYTLALPALILTAYFLAWQVEPQAITRERAGRIDEAIARFAAERGRYPASLSDLTPAYLPYFLGPLTGRDQVWCYEGGRTTTGWGISSTGAATSGPIRPRMSRR